MTQTIVQSQPINAAGGKLPPVSAPSEVADSGLIRIGAAVGRPTQR